jgi:hypothetical protein
LFDKLNLTVEPDNFADAQQSRRDLVDPTRQPSDHGLQSVHGDSLSRATWEPGQDDGVLMSLSM